MSSGLESLYSYYCNYRQYHRQLFGLIARTVKNLKKIGSSKITRGVVKIRIEASKLNWDKFTSNHESLLRLCSAEHKKMPYLRDDLYLAFKQKFLDAHGTILDMLENLDPSNQSTFSTDVSINALTASRSRAGYLALIHRSFLAIILNGVSFETCSLQWLFRIQMSRPSKNFII